MKYFRPHIGGDFLNRGKVDRSYVAALLRALRKAGQTVKVQGWVYTHAWREMSRHAKYLRRLGIMPYASVHNVGDAIDARLLGYSIAYVSNVPKHEAQKRRKLRYLPVLKAIGCPEQLGTKADCGSCGYCAHGGSVAFYKH